jgi:serine/threonine-protein kinase
MNTNRWQRMRDLFHEALELEPDDRPAFLEKMCVDDPKLKHEVEEMLAADKGTHGFLEHASVEQESLHQYGENLVGKQVGHYRIKQLISSGGMGFVYLAEDSKLERIVALKFLAPKIVAEREGKSLFLDEARSAAALDHENICTIHEIDEKEGMTFIAMAYIEGKSLKDRIEARTLDLNEAIDLAIQVTRGLAEAHKKGIVHKDIKPANIVVTSKGRAKIIDFGLANYGVPGKGPARGTIAYMSPEQFRGTAIDHRTDIWSMGAVLYEMLTGEVFFKGEAAFLLQDSEPTLSLPASVPREIAFIVEKALKINPSERYQHAEEMLSDLQRVRRSARSRKKSIYIAVSVAMAAIMLVFALIYLFPGSDEPIRSIAVLPLKNLSDDEDQEYLVDGITEALIVELCKVSSLKRVISHQSMIRYKGTDKTVSEIAGELDVDAVVEGSVRHADGRIRVTAQLIDSTQDERIWVDEFDRDLDNILLLQREVARTIAKEINAAVAPEDRSYQLQVRTVDPEIYQDYLKGRYFWNKRDEKNLKKGIYYFERVIQRNPDFALAYAGLADCYACLPDYSGCTWRDVYSKARDAALKAIELDNTLAEPHASLGLVKMYYEWDFDGAEREYKRSIELNSNYATAHHWYAIFLASMTRFDEAIKEIHLARELDPLSLIINTGVGLIHLFARQYDKALEGFQGTAELDPEFTYTSGLRGLAYMHKAEYEKALKEILKSLANKGENDLQEECWLGLVYAKMGRIAEAREVLESFDEQSKSGFVHPIYSAAIYFALGENEEGFRWLEKAYEERGSEMIYLKVCPWYDEVIEDPRFIALLKKVGF